MLRAIKLYVIRIRPITGGMPIEMTFVEKQPSPKVILQIFNEVNGPNSEDASPDEDLQPFRDSILAERYSVRETFAYQTDHLIG